jgi:predicted nucleotidyltransferase component of viral defense system
MARKALRVVSENDAPAEPLSLLEAVEAGDILAIMKAQRRIIAESLTTAADNTRPQFSNELNKLNALIREEESRRSVESEDASVVAPLEAEAWNGTGY